MDGQADLVKGGLAADQCATSTVNPPSCTRSRRVSLPVPRTTPSAGPRRKVPLGLATPGSSQEPPWDASSAGGVSRPAPRPWQSAEADYTLLAARGRLLHEHLVDE